MSDQSNAEILPAEIRHDMFQLAEKLKKDIQSLGGMLCLKEVEWNVILKLKKQKEIELIQSQREQTVMDVNRSTAKKVANFPNLVAWAQQDNDMPSPTGNSSLCADGIDEKVKGAMESWDGHIRNVIVKAIENYSKDDPYKLLGGIGGKNGNKVGNDLEGTCGLNANRSIDQLEIATNLEKALSTATGPTKFTDMLMQMKKALDVKKEKEKAAKRVAKESREPAFSSTSLKSRFKKKWSPRKDIRLTLGKRARKTQNVNGTVQAPTPSCQNCGQKSNYVCAGCSTQRYCSRDCQVAAWDDHSQTCHLVGRIDPVHRPQPLHFLDGFGVTSQQDNF